MICFARGATFSFHFSLFSLIWKKSLLREERRVKREKWRVQKEKAADATFSFWPALRDLNPRPTESESVALSNWAKGGYNMRNLYYHLFLKKSRKSSRFLNGITFRMLMQAARHTSTIRVIAHRKYTTTEIKTESSTTTKNMSSISTHGSADLKRSTPIHRRIH